MFTPETGSSDLRPFRNFQIRWAEKLGYPECPYLIRWTFLFFGYSVRIHHWIKSDDNRFFHDHAANLLSIVLYGKYWNVKPIYPDKNPTDTIIKVTPIDWDVPSWYNGPDYVESRVKNIKRHYVEGIFNSLYNFLHPCNSIWFSKAEDRHYLEIPKGGAWTLMFEGRPRHKWGFYVNGHKWRPWKYFHKFGIIQTKSYQ